MRSDHIDVDPSKQHSICKPNLFHGLSSFNTSARILVSEWWFNAISATEAIFTARTCTYSNSYKYTQSNLTPAHPFYLELLGYSSVCPRLQADIYNSSVTSTCKYSATLIFCVKFSMSSKILLNMYQLAMNPIPSSPICKL